MTNDWRVEVAAQHYANEKLHEVHPKDESEREVRAIISHRAGPALASVLSDAFVAGYEHGFATAMELPR